jgi:hypothetical protein
MASKPYDLRADKLKATTAPMFFIHGVADGVRLAQINPTGYDRHASVLFDRWGPPQRMCANLARSGTGF